MKQLQNNKKAVLASILAAFLYALCIPALKVLEPFASPVATGALLYLGAGFGLFFTTLIQKSDKNLMITKKELPYTAAMIVLDILAISLLILGIKRTNSASVSLLSNFELVATSAVAYFFFKEKISKKLFFAIILITIACIILGYENGRLLLNLGSILVLCACVCWGLENNCTKMLSKKDTRQITIIKGIFTGLGSLFISHLLQENLPSIKYIILILLLGFISYGVSVSLYIFSQRHQGAAKTGSYYSLAPYFGVILSVLFLGDTLDVKFFVALIIMTFATALLLKSD